MAGCAAEKAPPPVNLEPLREQITILQKQMLELQRDQIETRRRVDEQAAAEAAVAARVKALEGQLASRSSTTVPGERDRVKKAAKKQAEAKKPARRQQP